MTHDRLQALEWRHNGCDDVPHHQPYECLLNRLYRRRSKKTSKLRVTGLCARNSPGTDEFPAQMASNSENVSIWWRHHGQYLVVSFKATSRGQQPFTYIGPHVWNFILFKLNSNYSIWSFKRHTRLLLQHCSIPNLTNLMITDTKTTNCSPNDDLHVYMYICMSLHVCVYMYVCICLYIYIFLYLCSKHA